MDKWLLLAITLVSVFVAYESVQWLLTTQRSSTADLEKTVGYQVHEPGDRHRVAMDIKYSSWGLPKLVMFLCAMAVGLVLMTVHAFLE